MGYERHVNPTVERPTISHSDPFAVPAWIAKNRILYLQATKG
jgi:hypothetical protein